jgi:hypothetical protein
LLAVTAMMCGVGKHIAQIVAGMQRIAVKEEEADNYGY